jgi:hypothetical protein
VRQIDAIISAERHRTQRIRWQDAAESSADSPADLPLRAGAGKQQVAAAAGQATAPGFLPEMQKC